MKILFFSYLSHDDNDYRGGGWVKSLAELISSMDGYEVGLAYITRSSLSKKRVESRISYYPIYHKLSLLRKIYTRILKDPDEIYFNDETRRVIDNFSPDIIQLFGLETNIGSILKQVTNVPVVVHLQGICSGIKDKWFPMAMSSRGVWWYSPLKEKLFCKTATDLYQRFLKLSEIEFENYKVYKYYLGRTDWDYQVSRLLAPNSKYYECNEVLRSAFYNHKWHYVEKEEVIISTVMNGEIYKGFDTILRTAKLLKDINIKFKWNIYGVDESFSLRRAIEQYVKAKFKYCNVYFCGKKDAEELAILLSASSFYVHPSHIDNSPNALCEAMLLGVPSIATYVGGVPSLIKNGWSGYLVPDSESYQIAYLIKTLKSDKEKLSILSVNAHITALKRHDKKDIMENLNEVYHEIISDFKQRK